jgi:hypothetical protein
VFMYVSISTMCRLDALQMGLAINQPKTSFGFLLMELSDLRCIWIDQTTNDRDDYGAVVSFKTTRKMAGPRLTVTMFCNMP